MSTPLPPSLAIPILGWDLIFLTCPSLSWSLLSCAWMVSPCVRMTLISLSMSLPLPDDPAKKEEEEEEEAAAAAAAVAALMSAVGWRVSPFGGGGEEE